MGEGRLYSFFAGKIKPYKKRVKSLLVFFILIVFSFGCSNKTDDTMGQFIQSEEETPYECSYAENSQSRIVALIPFIEGGIIQGVTCQSCHTPHHRAWSGLTIEDHGDYFFADGDDCEECHGGDFSGGISKVSCNVCHHGAAAEGHAGMACETCHDFSGGIGLPEDCTACHDNHHSDYTGLEKVSVDSTSHGTFYPAPGGCESCHGAELETKLPDDSCNTCHHGTGGMAEGHAGIDCDTCHDFSGGGGGLPSDCTACHSNHHDDYPGLETVAVDSTSHGTFYPAPGGCESCHGSELETELPEQSCNTCHHGTGPMADGHAGIACDTCHDFSGGGGGLPADCTACHDNHHTDYPGLELVSADSTSHGTFYPAPGGCEGCHGSELETGLPDQSCNTCHHGTGGMAEGHAGLPCETCHDFSGSGGGPSGDCTACHSDHHSLYPGLETVAADSTSHGTFYPAPGGCESCHGANFETELPDDSCNTCHHGSGGMADGHSGLSCDTCHDFGGGGGTTADCSDCHGGDGSHVVHISAGSARGPVTPLSCETCHDSNNYPAFGNDGDNETLAETDVCDPCHSQGGPFDGINDASIGAKTNWSTGIYDGDNLKPGKERWCAGCHDSGTSVISGVTAPDLMGDNIDYGFYASGHGKAGFDVDCLDCHDGSINHIDGISRTYSSAGDNYNASFRFSAANGMDIPRSSTYNSSQFTLCYSCHDNEAKFIGDWTNTNFRNLNSQGFNLGWPTNNHQRWHLDFGSASAWDSDRDSIRDSAMTCPSCHNPHSSMEYNGQATIAMTHQDLGLMRDSDIDGPFVYIESLGFNIIGGDVYCTNCHSSSGDITSKRYKYYYME